MIFNKKIYILLTTIIICYFSIIQLFSQNNINLPSVILKDVKGKTFNTSDIVNKGNPLIICFIKTCCSDKNNLLDEIAEDYENWKTQTKVVLYVISTDDSRSSCKVAPMANVKEWNFPILLDINSNFKEKMNVIINPHVFIFDRNGKMVWQKAGYVSDEKDEIYEQILKL